MSVARSPSPSPLLEDDRPDPDFRLIRAWACTWLNERSFQDVILLSVAFMLVGTASSTVGNIEQTVLASITQHDDPTFTGNGYTGQGIINCVFSVCNWIAPSIIAVLEAKGAMIIGGIIYIIFTASFLFPQTWLIYSMSVVAGFGSALLWTAQGNYLTLSSTPETIGRNSGVFWCVLQFSMFFGNALTFWEFRGNIINKHKRMVIFSTLALFAMAGTVCLCFLRRPRPQPTIPGPLNIQTATEVPIETAPSGFSAFKTSVQLFMKKEMALLSVVFFYTGAEGCFIWGVYSTSLGFTELFGADADRLVGLCGILIGAGEIVGGALFSVLGSGSYKVGRNSIVFVGFVCHTIAYYVIYLNLPNASPLGLTSDYSYINPPVAWIALFAAFLMGFGDACFNTQIYSLLGDVFHAESASAFALFMFVQSTAAAIGLFSSTSLYLRTGLSILQLFCTLGTLAFFCVEWSQVKKPNADRECEYSILHADDENDNNDMA